MGSSNEGTGVSAHDERRRVSVFGGALATGAGMVVRQLTAIAMSVIVARSLGTGGKGELALVSQYAGIAALVASLGFEGAHAYFVGRKRRSAEEAVSDSIAYVSVVAVAAVAALWLILRFGVPALSETSSAALMLGAATVAPMLAISLFTGVLIGIGQVRGQAVAAVASSGVSFTVVALAALLGRLNVSVALVGTLAGLVVGTAVLVAHLGVSRLPRPSLRRMREEASYAWKSYVQNVAGFLELRQDVLLLGVMSSSGAVGVYSTGVSLGELIYFVPQAVVLALTSRALQEEHGAGAELTASVTRLLFAFSVASTLALGLVARPLTSFVFGPEFAGAATIFLLLAPGVLSWALASQLQAFLAAHGRLFPGLGVVAVSLNLALNLLLIPRYGIIGAAVATSLSYCVGNGYVTWVFLKRTRSSLTDLMVPRAADLALVRIALGSRLGRRDG